eukprot:GEMP01054397.1.p1 GENE.GEMP01054397.1~~GEMP01054397.1.p1  ORF type:complete len:374 (+),score=74.35 GEMP01054397.1:359-1480(+)
MNCLMLLLVGQFPFITTAVYAEHTSMLQREVDARLYESLASEEQRGGTTSMGRDFEHVLDGSVSASKENERRASMASVLQEKKKVGNIAVDAPPLKPTGTEISLLQREMDAKYKHEENCATFTQAKCEKSADCVFIQKTTLCESKCGKTVLDVECRKRGCHFHAQNGCVFHQPDCATMTQKECEGSEHCVTAAQKATGATKWWFSSDSTCTPKECSNMNARMAVCQRVSHCKWNGAGQDGTCVPAPPVCELVQRAEECADKNCKWNAYFPACVSKVCQDYANDKGGCDNNAECTWTANGKCIVGGLAAAGPGKATVASMHTASQTDEKQGSSRGRLLGIMLLGVFFGSVAIAALYVMLQRSSRRQQNQDRASP